MNTHEHALFVDRHLYPIGLIYDKMYALSRVDKTSASIKTIMQSQDDFTISEALQHLQMQLDKRTEKIFIVLDEYGENAVKDVLFKPSYNRRNLYYKGRSLGFDGMEIDRHSGVNNMTIDIAFKYETRGCWWSY